MNETFLYFIVAGFLAGILGGMGMGGGTILIPILTLVLGIFQKEAQALNLISFVPMAILAIILHAKNKLIDFRGVLFIIVPAAVTSYFSSRLALVMSGVTLQNYFGIFLMALGIFQIVTETVKWIRERKKKKSKQEAV